MIVELKKRNVVFPKVEIETIRRCKMTPNKPTNDSFRWRTLSSFNGYMTAICVDRRRRASLTDAAMCNACRLQMNYKTFEVS